MVEPPQIKSVLEGTMLKALTIFIFALMVFDSQASVKEIYLPTLECQDNTFKDVSVNFDDTKTSSKEITISLICQRLNAKLVKQTVVADLSRFIVDKMAPE